MPLKISVFTCTIYLSRHEIQNLLHTVRMLLIGLAFLSLSRKKLLSLCNNVAMMYLPRMINQQDKQNLCDFNHEMAIQCCAGDGRLGGAGVGKEFRG